MARFKYNRPNLCKDKYVNKHTDENGKLQDSGDSTLTMDQWKVKNMDQQRKLRKQLAALERDKQYMSNNRYESEKAILLDKLESVTDVTYDIIK